MKKVVLFGLLLSLLCVKVTFAAYEFTVVGSTTSIAASLTGIADNKNSFQLIILNKPFEEKYVQKSGGLDGTVGLPLHPDSETIKKPVAGEIRWNLDNYSPQTVYYARVVEIPVNKPSTAFFATEQKIITSQQATITPDKLLFEYKDVTALIKGRVNPATNPNFSKYTIGIQFSKEPFSSFTAVNPPTYGVYKTHEISIKEDGIASDGTYHLFVPNLNLDTAYNFRETITYGGTTKITDGVFKSGTGYVISSPENVQSDFENRSYRLLAPLPGLNMILDPDLCQEQVNQGKAVFGGSCDDQVSALINLILKILIGAAAVLLVLRIMFEGYKYITSDIPRLKTNAKSGLWDAVLGLVLALSSFLILNTINPKLLENTIKAERLEIELDEENITEVGAGITVGGTTVKIKAGSVAKCVGGVVDIPKDIPTTKPGKICKDLLVKLYILKSKTTDWQITSTMSGTHASSCHATGNAKSGNCVDIQMKTGFRQGYTEATGSTNPAWGNLCVAVAEIGGLNYANEASSVQRCQSIKKYQTFTNTSGPHLHINYIGG